MATLAANALTLADWAKRLDPSGEGKISSIIELLGQTNEILDDKLWMEGNLVTGHRTTVRTGLPNVFWRLINQGVQPSKSQTAQIDEATGCLEAWSEVDKKLADLAGNQASFRLSEAMAFIEAMNQEMASTLIYGNASVSPEEFNGLSIRYSSLAAENAQNIIDNGGTGSDNTSIWLICWGDNSVHGIFPKGSQAGLRHFDHGEVTVETTAGIAGTRLRAYQDQWTWDCGVALRDWRFVVRSANIDVSNLVAKTSAADLIESMIKMMHRLPTMKMGKCAFYMNRTVKQMLDIQRRDDVAGAGMQYAEVDGKLVPHFRQIPIRTVDSILDTEAQVS